MQLDSNAQSLASKNSIFLQGSSVDSIYFVGVGSIQYRDDSGRVVAVVGESNFFGKWTAQLSPAAQFLHSKGGLDSEKKHALSTWLNSETEETVVLSVSNSALKKARDAGKLSQNDLNCFLRFAAQVSKAETLLARRLPQQSAALLPGHETSVTSEAHSSLLDLTALYALLLKSQN